MKMLKEKEDSIAFREVNQASGGDRMRLAREPMVQ